jgi:branched-chain amino acid transport system substrate-binding protein
VTRWLKHRRRFPRRAAQHVTIAGLALALLGVSVVGDGSSSAVGSTPSTETKAPIVVGNVSTLSGPQAEGIGLQPALKAWADSINAVGGIHGQPIKLVVMDDQGDPVQALSDVKQLVTQDHAVALVSTFDQDAESSYFSFLNQTGVPDIGGWGTAINPSWTTSPLLFPVTTTATAVVGANVVAAKDVGAKAVGLPYCLESPQCKQLVPVIQKITGGVGLKWAGGVGVSSSQPTYTAACLQLQGAHADALMDAIYDPARFLQSCAQQNYKPKFTVTISGVLATPFEGSATWDGQLVGVSPNYPWTANNSKTAAFRAAMAKYAPGAEIGPDAMNAWMAGLMFQIAANAVPGTLTPASLTHSLRQISNQTLGGLAAQPITYTNPASHPINCFFVIRFSHKDWTSVMPPKPQCTSS